jgi:hypothetical protein
MKFLLLSLFFLVFSPLVSRAADIEGRLFEKGSRIPLKEVNIFILPHKLKATTDDQGNFKFTEVPDGDFQFVITQTNYQRLERDDTTERTNSRILFLEKESYTGFETTIVDQKAKRDDSVKSLSQAKFLNLPGSGGDPVKAVQNLPGVNRVQGFSSQVVIQGSSPGDTRYNLDSHEIPQVFHFGGLTSVVMPEAVERVDYFSAGYGSEYSRAMGGIINLETRSPDVKDRDRKSFFFVDNLKMGGLIEGKISDTESYLVSGRYSYVGQFLRLALRNNDSLGLTAAPDFSDLTFVYKNKLSSQEDLKIDFLASRDTLGFVLKEPLKGDPGLRGNFRNETNFIRFIPQYSKKIDEERKYKISSGLGQSVTLVDIGDQYLNINSKSLSLRAEYEQKLADTLITQVGTDNTYADAKVDINLPNFASSGGVTNPFSSSKPVRVSTQSRIFSLGLYNRYEWNATADWTLIPALRLDHFSQVRETVTSPRLASRYKLSESLLLKAATGLYYQPPAPQEAGSDYGNPDINSPSALHLTFGFEKDFREGKKDGFQFSSSYFRRDFRNLVIGSSATLIRDEVSVPEVYNNKGAGLAQGIESQLNFDQAPWSGWVSYTYSRSQRWDPANPPYNYQYDQTHNFNLVASFDWGKNRTLSGRYRYVSGNPYTPVVGGVFDSDNDVYIPIRGQFYSQRLPAFNQLDLRFDKKWILNTEIWSVYVDIQNVLNTKNSESLMYSYNYEKQQSVFGLPFLPALGVKGEF